MNDSEEHENKRKKVEDENEEQDKKRKKVEDENDLVALSLRCDCPRQTPPEPTRIHHKLYQSIPPQSHPFGSRPSPTQVKSDTIPPPFPWATDHRATVYSLKDLLKNQIFIVTGEVQCKKCDRKFEMEFDLEEKFVQLWSFIAEHKSGMHDRAPPVWMNPILPSCKHCGQENSVKPIISEKKRSINWLFLLLGQMLGCCRLEQLKYFCKHTKNHRTGAKDRVLYLTYMGICKQLDPKGPFDL